MPRARTPKALAVQAFETTDPDAQPAERDETLVLVLQVGSLTGTVEDILMPGIGHLVELPEFCLADLEAKGIVTRDVFEDDEIHGEPDGEEG